MNKRILLLFTCALLFISFPKVNAAYIIKNNQTYSNLKLLESKNESSGIINTISSNSVSSFNEANFLPRGRGNGRKATTAFVFGWFCLFPFLSLILGPFVYIYGIRNMNRQRKCHGFAIAGMILATVGLIVTIAVLATL